MMPITQKEQKNIRALQTIKGRRDQNRFVAEGVRLLEESSRHNFKPICIYYADSMLNDRSRSLVESFRAKKTAAEPITPSQMDRISDVRTSQGILGLYAIPRRILGASRDKNYRRILLCDNVSDPGNLGTLLRSALAFGFSAVVISGRTADPYAPKVVRSSAGSIFGLEIFTATYAAVSEFKSRQGSLLLAADSRGTNLNASTDTADTSLILAVGSEAEGLSREIVALADRRVRLPHSDRVESLNVAVAGSILMNLIYSSD